MLVRVICILIAAACLAGCSESLQPSPVLDPATGAIEAVPEGDPAPGVSPARCQATQPPPPLATPDLSVVERTEWMLVRVGSCRPRAGTGQGASFGDGHMALSADCNGQSAPFRVDGDRIEIDQESTSTTTADCGPDAVVAYIDAIASWGIAPDDRLYLLDENDQTLAILVNDGAPGCWVDVPPNGRMIAAPGEGDCDTSGLSDDFRLQHDS